MITITINQKYLIKTLNGNQDFDQQVYDLRDKLLIYGSVNRKEGDIIYMEIKDNVGIDIEDFLLIMSKDDGDIINYHPFIRVDVDDIDAIVPPDLPNSTYLINDEVKNHSWYSWRDIAHPLPEPIDGYYYFMSATFGETLSGKELLSIHESLEADLVSVVPYVNDNVSV